MSVWAAIFLLCAPNDCITAGSPLFKTKEECQYATKIYGLNHVAGNFPEHVVISWMCVSFGEVSNDI
mgnify:FL=1